MSALPQLVDTSTLRDELGVSRSVAEKLLRQCESVTIPGVRKWYARRADVAAILERTGPPVCGKVGQVAAAHIQQRTLKGGKKRWIVNYRLGGRQTAKQYAGTFAQRKHALIRLDYVRGLLAAGKDPRAELAKLQAPAERKLGTFIDAYKASRVDMADTSRRDMESHFKRIRPTFAHLAASQVTVPIIRQWLKTLETGDPPDVKPLKPASARRYFTTLRLLLDFAGADPNPARDKRVKLPRAEQVEKRIPTATEIERTLEHVAAQWQLPLRVLAATGARVSEVGQWAWGDVDTSSCRILNRQGKTRAARRWVAVPEDLIADLVATCPPDDRTAERRLFPGATKDAVGQAVARACKHAGVPRWSPHDLRHRYISVQLARGVPVANVGAQVGHAKTSLTWDVYSHVIVDAGELEAETTQPRLHPSVTNERPEDSSL